MKTQQLLKAFLPGLLFLSMVACGGDDGGGSDDGPAASELTAEGWTLFEASDYTGAIAKFQEALAADPLYREANAGIGWSQLRSGNLSEATTEFGTAKQDAAQVDAFAGNAFVSLAVNDHAGTISDAETVIAADASYSFSHDSDVDVDDMKLLAAFGYFYTSDYESCLALVLELNPSFNTSPTTMELLAELERLQGL